MRNIFQKSKLLLTGTVMFGLISSAFADEFLGAASSKAGDIGKSETQFKEWLNPVNGVYRINAFSVDKNDSASQFFIVFADSVVPVGTPIDVKFDYRKSEDGGVVKFNSHGHANPQVYVNDDGWETLVATDNWQTYEGSFVTTGEIRTLAVNASIAREDAVLYLRNIVIAVNHENTVVTRKTEADSEYGYHHPYNDEDGFVYSNAEKTHLIGYEGSAKDITIPNPVTCIYYEFNNHQITIDCYEPDRKKYNSITVPNSVTYIDLQAFNGVKNVIYSGKAEGSPWGAQTVNGTIDGDFVYADAEKTNLTAYMGNDSVVVIPDGVVSIGNYAFEDYEGLKSVTIPQSVTSIHYWAFNNFRQDVTIYCEANSALKDWASNWKGICKVVWSANNTNPGTAVAESAANSVNIYAAGKTIVVENATEEIRVYDAMGRLVGRDVHVSTRTTSITVNNPGTYIVKTGGVVKRVVMNR